MAPVVSMIHGINTEDDTTYAERGEGREVVPGFARLASEFLLQLNTRGGRGEKIHFTNDRIKCRFLQKDFLPGGF